MSGGCPDLNLVPSHLPLLLTALLLTAGCSRQTMKYMLLHESTSCHSENVTNLIAVLGQVTRTLGFVVSLLTASFGISQEPPEVHSPVSPEQSLTHMVVAPGLEVQLAAHEPQVVDPVAIRFDEDGRMWVVEMRDYPNGPQEGELPKSRISILQDHDGDGLFETAAVFADNLLFANGIQPWKGGVFVTMAGEVAYLKDTDGDGRADVAETWYAGFEQRNPQLRASHPRLALDNHIYVASGLSGGTIVDAAQSEAEPVSISGMDFRFDPLTRKFEAVSGQGQYGLSFDDYGNRFVCSNRNPTVHIVLENQYLLKNPLVKAPAVSWDVARAGAESRVFPITRSWTTSNLHAGQITAACSVTIYRGGTLPVEFHGNVFVCEPTGHLVHREVMQPSGITFTSSPARDGVEFLASRDQWCSPVNLEVGPDGSLYVVDMYRAVIEHPDWVPDELKDRADQLFGNDRGRIYRIVRKGDQLGAPRPKLSSATSVSLVDNLAHANAWWRETSARLLIERADQSVGPQLRRMTMEHESPLARIHALRVMEGLGLIADDFLSNLCEDANARVLEQTITVSEDRLEGTSGLRDKITRLCAHEDPRVRYHAMLALAPFPVIPTTVSDEWELHALLIAAGNRAGTVLARLLEGLDQRDSDSIGPLIDELAALAAASKDDEQCRLAVHALLASDDLGRVGLTRFLAEAARSGASVASVRGKLEKAQQLELDQLFDEAQVVALNLSEPDSARGAAIDLLALSSDTAQTLVPIAIDDPSQSVRFRAISRLSQRTEVEPWRRLLAGFSSELPSARREILDGVLARSDRTNWLLNEIAAGTIKASELGRNHTDRLIKHPDAEIKARAKQLMSDAIPADRQKVLADYQNVLTMSADARRGRDVFKKNCATCHRIDDVGIDVAPDISDSRTKSPEQYLTDIVDPNRAIDSNYLGYTLITEDGRTFSGILATETSTSITLKQAEGKTLTLGRDEIDELTSSDMSFMPEGLEKEVAHQEMADLIAFIKNWRYLDGRTPLGSSPAGR